jgi:6-phosphogluconolactonase
MASETVNTFASSAQSVAPPLLRLGPGASTPWIGVAEARWPETGMHPTILDGHHRRYRRVLFGALAAVSALTAPSLAGFAFADEGNGAVYTMTNAPSGNAVVAFRRHRDGSLTPAGTFPTGGAGSGAGLGSGHAIVVSADGDEVVAVNAGSNTLSAFAVRDDRLELIGAPVPSGGTTPTSVTVHDDLVYVMNAGSNSIAGFRLDHRGLEPIAGSTQPLGTGTSMASQIQFDRSGRVLIVDERGGSGTIDTYLVDDDGAARHVRTIASSGGGPFGFDVDRRGHVLFSNAALGGGLMSGATSYDVSRTGILTPNGGPVSSGQAAACWLAAAGRFAFTTNAASGSIGRFAVAGDGELSLIGTTVIGAGAHPLDVGVSRNQAYLYVLADGLHRLIGYRVGADGSLTQVTTVAIPVGAAGVGAY